MAKEAVVKKKVKVSPDKVRGLAEGQMDVFKAESKARHELSNKLYDEQDEATQDALDRMTAVLCQIARRRMWFAVGNSDKVVLDIPDETIRHNMRYMAVEIMKDLALMDVRVAGFAFSRDLCAECYVEVKPRKKGKK